MFQPAVFREERTPVLHDLMRAHPFATLVTHLDGVLTADHVPLLLAEHGTIQGHIAVANPLAKVDGPVDVLAVFQGPQVYITPSYYPTKQETGKVVPTWNYCVVHARGTLRIVRDDAWLARQLAALTEAQESHRPVPWAVSDAPEDFMARQMKGIVGVEIAVTSLEGKWKVSQNKGAADRAGVVQGLQNEDSAAAKEIATLVDTAKS